MANKCWKVHQRYDYEWKVRAKNKEDAIDKADNIFDFGYLEGDGYEAEEIKCTKDIK